MRNIINVNFKKKPTPEPRVLSHSVLSYLQQCRNVLVHDDYIELMSAIIDPQFYAECDPDIQQLADGYFELHK